MGCGCGQGVTKRDSRPDQASVAQQRAVMCWACPEVHGGPWGGKRVCPDGETVRVKISIGGKGCPRDNHPDPHGVVRWLGLRFYGVPMPVRLAAWWFHGSHRRPGFWPGCGCAKWFKDLWTTLRPSTRETAPSPVKPAV